MTSVDHAPRSGGFLVALLRAGAPVIAALPDDLPDEAVDPSPLPGWRRISMMAGHTGLGEVDTLLMRACRFVVLVPLAYRVVAIPVLLLSVFAANQGTGVVPAAALATFAAAVNLAAIVWVLRVRGFRQTVAKNLLAADVLIGFAINIVGAMLVPDPAFAEVGEMTWAYLVGSVALWTLARGVPAGVALIVASVPFHVLMCVVGRHRAPAVVTVVDDVVTLVPALVTAMVVLLLIGLGTRLAMGVGIRRGRRVEQARTQRALHDTVLQTLEAMALRPVSAPSDLDTALTQLAQLRAMARHQALQLRQELTRPLAESGQPSAGLGEDLAAIAAEMAREGLRAQLVFTDVDDGDLPEARRRAIRDAVREAMRNTIKHADTDEVVVRIERRDGGVAVIARDHGTGFSEADRPAGFGISQSIMARLAEVGGRSTIQSEPGRGTRVTLWVPL